MARIDEIISKSIRDYLIKEVVVDKFTPWDPDTKMDRMQPGNAARSKGTAHNGDFGVMRGYNDWKDNFKQAMSYKDYCKKFNLSF